MGRRRTILKAWMVSSIESKSCAISGTGMVELGAENVLGDSEGYKIHPAYAGLKEGGGCGLDEV